MPANTYFFMEHLSPLYEDVQSREIFPDSKFFVDCIPKFPVEEILQQYANAKKEPAFDLRAFVAANFDISCRCR